MEKFDSIIFITPNIGEYHQRNVFCRNINAEEINFLGDDLMVEYRMKCNSYGDCIKDLKEKMKKIKSILEDTNG
jgi:hypothetical protein